MIPIECEYGFPNCLSGFSWGGHISIPGTIIAPPMQTVTIGQHGGGSGIIQTIVQQIAGIANTNNQGVSGTGCHCSNVQGESVCMCTQGSQNPTPANVASNIIEQAKTFATAHPFIALGVVGGAVYMIFGKTQ